MSDMTTGAPAPRTCVVCNMCNMIVPVIDRMWSELTNDHFRNARVEFLKGIRCLIDAQIKHLSRPDESKGKKVMVE